MRGPASVGVGQGSTDPIEGPRHQARPRAQERKRPVLAPQLHTLAALIREQPDRTLAERQGALATSASLTTIWRAVNQLGFTLEQNDTRFRTRPPRHRGRARAVGSDRPDPRPDPPRLSG